MVALFLAGAAGAASASPSADFRKQCDKLLTQKGKTKEAQRLHTLFKAHWEYSMREFPESATWRGYPGQNQRWTDYSLVSVARRKDDTQTALKVVQSINRTKLSVADQLNFDLFNRNLELAHAAVPTASFGNFADGWNPAQPDVDVTNDASTQGVGL